MLWEQPDAAAVPQEAKGSGLTLKEGVGVKKATFVTKITWTIPAYVLQSVKLTDDKKSWSMSW